MATKYLDKIDGWSGKLRDYWAPLRGALRTLYLCRLSVLLSLIGFGVLVTPQGNDVLFTLGENVAGAEGIFKLYAALPLLSVFIWAISVWYFTRLLLQFNFHPWPAGYNTANDPKTNAQIGSGMIRWCIAWFPRILGLSAFISVEIAFSPDTVGLAPGVPDAIALLRWFNFALAVLFVGFVVCRRWIVPFLRETRNSGQTISFTQLPSAPRYARLSDAFSQSRSLVAFIVVFAALGLVMHLGSWWYPTFIGSTLSPPVLFFVWAGTWMPLATALIYFSTRYRLPVLTFLLLVAVLSSWSNDNHHIRTLGAGGVAFDNTDPRPSLTEAVDQWIATQPAPDPGQEARPMLIVATAGGGSRAAYWTATVLGELTACVPGFQDSLFAISGVSGGSVGAAMYRAMLDEAPANPASPPNCNHAVASAAGDTDPARETPLQRAAAGDFLGPALASLLYADLVQRFIPITDRDLFFRADSPADRARSLELAFENAFDTAFGLTRSNEPQRGMRGSFARRSVVAGSPVADGGGWKPLLLLNGTWVENGRRIITSNVRIDPSHGNEPFASAHDLLHELGSDIRLSTAATNSARFPAVMPAGTIVTPQGDRRGHVVDGGYYENFGAATAEELIDAVSARLEAAGHDAKILVLQISSDPTLQMNADRLCDQTDCDPASILFAPEFRSPPATILATRSSRGLQALLQLEAAAADRFFHLRLCPPGTNPDPAGQRAAELEPPLGWSLSELARTQIRKHLSGSTKTGADAPTDCLANNRKSFGELTQELNGRPG